MTESNCQFLRARQKLSHLTNPPKKVQRLNGRCVRCAVCRAITVRMTPSECVLPLLVWMSRNSIWCAGRDSNSHDFRHQFLRLACIPFHHLRKLLLRTFVVLAFSTRSLLTYSHRFLCRASEQQNLVVLTGIEPVS